MQLNKTRFTTLFYFGFTVLFIIVLIFILMNTVDAPINWENGEITSALIGCVPVTLAFVFQVYAFCKEGQKNRVDRAYYQFLHLCDNFQKSKETLNLQLPQLGSYQGAAVIDALLTIYSDIIDILQRDYTYNDGVHRKELYRNIHEAQHNMELCGGTPELEIDLEQDLIDAEAELQREVRYYNVCQLLSISESKWEKLHALPIEDQKHEAAKILLSSFHDTLQRYHNSVLALGFFLGHCSQEAFTPFALSQFEACEIKYIELWSKIQTPSNKLANIQKLFKSKTS